MIGGILLIYVVVAVMVLLGTWVFDDWASATLCFGRALLWWAYAVIFAAKFVARALHAAYAELQNL